MIGTEMTSVTRAIEGLLEIGFVKDKAELQKALHDLYHKINQDYYTVVVLGEFKRGKSSFINALLKKQILPTDVLPETATINMIMYNETPQLQVIYKDGKKEDGEVSLAYLQQFSASSGSEKSNAVDYIKIGYPLEILKDRIVLVDTPGVADMDDMRTDVTYEFLPQANAVIFLLDANTPLTQTEKEFVEEHLVSQGISDILFIVNKYDCVDDEEDEDFLAELKSRLDAVFKMGTAEASLKSFTILPLSAKMALQGVAQDNVKLVEASGINEVQEYLWKILSTGTITQKKQQYAMHNLQRIAKWISDDIEKQIAITQAGIDELAKLERMLSNEMDDRERRRSSIDDYVLSVQDKIFAICDKSIQTFGHKLHDDIMEQIELYQGTDFKEFIEVHIARRIQKNIENWVGLYTPQINTLVKALEREISMGLSHEFNQRVQLETALHGEMKTFQKSLQLSATDISNVNYQAGAIAAAGGIGLAAIVGSSVMPIIGFAALPYLRSYMLKKKLAEAKKDVIPVITAKLNKIDQQLQSDVHKYIFDECKKVQLNTDYAYSMVLERLKENISSQINEKRAQSSGKISAITKLQEDARRVKYIIGLIGGKNGRI